MFTNSEQIHCGYYRAKDYPPYKAVYEFVQACHSSLMRMLPIHPGMLTLEKVEAIHRQRCAELPSAWSTAHPSLRHDTARGERHAATRESKRQRKQQSKAGPNAKADTKRVKEACGASAIPSCQAFALVVPCPRQMNSAGTACLFTKVGAAQQELAHSCPFQDPAGSRCGAAHAMVNAH